MEARQGARIAAAGAPDMSCALTSSDHEPRPDQLLRLLASGHEIWAWSATTISPSTAGGAPRWQTSSTSPSTSLDPGGAAEQNYRSSGRILAAAHAIIEKNERRAEKKLWTAAGEGEKVRVFLAEDERDEGPASPPSCTRRMPGHGLIRDGRLLPANAQSRALEDALRARRVPRWCGGDPYDRAEVKDIAAYLRLCVNRVRTGSAAGDQHAASRIATPRRAPARLCEPASFDLGGVELHDPEMPIECPGEVAPFKR